MNDHGRDAETGCLSDTRRRDLRHSARKRTLPCVGHTKLASLNPSARPTRSFLSFSHTEGSRASRAPRGDSASKLTLADRLLGLLAGSICSGLPLPRAVRPVPPGSAA
eukprot:5610412-Pyramimonas_sp.AAC.1